MSNVVLRAAAIVCVIALSGNPFRAPDLSDKPNKSSLSFASAQSIQTNVRYDRKTNIDHYYAIALGRNNRLPGADDDDNGQQLVAKAILPAATQQSSDENGAAFSNGDDVGGVSELPQVAGALINLRGLAVPTVNRLQSQTRQQRTGKHLFAAINDEDTSGPSGDDARQNPSTTPTRSAARQQNAPQQSTSGDKQAAATGEAVCLTPGCVKAAAEILKNMDEKVDPCDDFYRYSCGNWIDTQVIPEDKTSVSLFSVVQDELDNKLRNLIEQRPASDSGVQETPIIGKMRNLYESCMNTSKYMCSCFISDKCATTRAGYQ